MPDFISTTLSFRVDFVNSSRVLSNFCRMRDFENNYILDPENQYFKLNY